MTVSLSTLYARIGKLMGIAKAQIDARGFNVAPIQSQHPVVQAAGKR